MRICRTAGFLALLLVAAPLAWAQPIPEDVRWDDRFHAPGVFADGGVRRVGLAPDGAPWVVAPVEDRISVTEPGVLRWDGTAWQPVGTLAPAPGQILSLAFTSDGTAYVGGQFLGPTASGAKLVRWTGAAWQSIPMPIGGITFVEDVRTAGMTLVARINNRVFRYAGGAWTELTRPSTSYVTTAIGVAPDGTVYAFWFVDGSVGISATHFIGRWDGSAWTNVGAVTGPAGYRGNWVGRIETDATGAVYLGSTAPGTSGVNNTTTSYSTVGGVTIASMARYASGAWTDVGAGCLNKTHRFAVRGTTVYTQTGARFEGGTCVATAAVVTPNTPAFQNTALVQDVVPDDQGRLYVAGDFRRIGTPGQPTHVAAYGVARLDLASGAWTALAGPTRNGLSYRPRVLLPAPDGGVYALGAFDYAGTVRANGAARWDGTRWHALSGGLTVVSAHSEDSGITDAVLDANGDIVAAGTFRTSGGALVPAARWNGSGWNAITPPSGWTVFSITRVLVVNGEPWFFGAMYAPGFVLVSGAIVGTDGAWRAIPAQNTAGDKFNGLSSAATDKVLATDGTGVYAYATFQTAAFSTYTGLYRTVNGGAWEPVASLSADPQIITALGFHGGALHVAGTFKPLGAPAYVPLARVQGGALVPVPGLDAGNGSRVGGFASGPDGVLYAFGGAYTGVGGLVGGSAAGEVARFDGATWTLLGSGGPDYGTDVPSTLVVTASGDLWIGTSRSFAGRRRSEFIARWRAVGGAPGSVSATPDAAPADGGTQTFNASNAPRLARLAWTAGTGTVPSSVALTVQAGTAAAGTSGPVVRRAWTFTATGGTPGWTASVRLYYDDAERPAGADEATFSLYKTEDGVAWTAVPVTARNTAENWIEGAVGSFSTFAIGAPGASLPVELVDVAARSDGPGRLRLSWTTAAETNNAGFDVLLAPRDAGAWTTAAFVPGQGTTTEQHRYARTLDGLAPGRYRVRLIQTDLDGTRHVAATVEATVRAAATGLVVTGPNPARGSTRIAFDLVAPGAVHLTLYDVQGREVARLADGSFDAGRTEVAVDTRGLAPGVYVARLVAGRATASRTLVVAR